MDNVIIHISNAASSSSTTAHNASLHWHGMHLFTPATGTTHAEIYDGPPLTQCPLKSGSNMTYRIKADHIGTHFWHSHFKLTLFNGIAGPLIVHDLQNDPYKNAYDEERVIMMQDWLNETAELHYYSYKGGWYNKTNNGTNLFSNDSERE